MGCQNNTLLRSLTNLSVRGRIRTFHPSAAALLPLFFSFFLLKKKTNIHFSFCALLFHFLISFLFRLFAFSFALASAAPTNFWQRIGSRTVWRQQTPERSAKWRCWKDPPTLPDRVDIVLPNSDPLHSVSVITTVRSAGKSLSKYNIPTWICFSFSKFFKIFLSCSKHLT